MNRRYRLLNSALLLTFAFAVAAFAAQIEGVRLFSDQDYTRLSISFDGPFTGNVETNPAEQLVFVRFSGAAIDNLTKQSYIYENNPHLESISFLPLGGGEIVARVKAKCDFRLKTYETAEPYRMILELSPRVQDETAPATTKSPFDYYQRGLSQMSAGSYETALTAFRSAIRSGDHPADSYYHAGRIRMRQGELDKAKINFSRALDSGGFGSEASLFLCWIDYKQNNRQGLKSGWSEFVRRVPDAAGRFRLATSNPEIDFRSLEDAAGSDPNPTLEADIFQAAAAQELPAGERTETLPASSPPAQSVSGPDAAWYFEQGVAAKQEGRLEAAAELLEKSVEIDPTSSETHFQLGVVYKSLDRKAASAREFRLSLEPPVSAGDNVPASGNTGENDLSALEPLNLRDNDQAGAEFDEALVDETVKENNVSNTDSVSNAMISGSQITGGESQPPAVTAETGTLASIRSAAAGMVQQYGISLLRKQVGILTALMGIIFALTLLAERIVRRKWGRRKSLAPPALPSFAAAAAGGGSVSLAVNRNSPAPAARRKQQVAQVLARELENKRRESRPAIDDGDDEIELQLRPVGQRGMYGVDIARRIKEELSPDGAAVASASSSVMAGGRRDDMQTRLIRQLRSKNWTIGDIAQEMNLSREEIKWALAGNSGEQSGSSSEDSAGRVESYGQLRALAARERTRSEHLDPERIDREVDLELEINV